MKKLLFTLCLLSFNSFAYDPVDCVRDLVREAPKTINSIAIRLCSGATSPEPVRCYVRSSDIDDKITVGISASLCGGSTSADKTLACYDKAFNGGIFNRGQSRDLCSARYYEEKF
jgi:hypothetical protein